MLINSRADGAQLVKLNVRLSFVYHSVIYDLVNLFVFTAQSMCICRPQSIKLSQVCNILKLKRLKPDKFFMGKPSQNYGVSPKYGVTQFYLQPDISEHTRLNPS